MTKEYTDAVMEAIEVSVRPLHGRIKALEQELAALKTQKATDIEAVVLDAVRKYAVVPAAAGSDLAQDIDAAVTRLAARYSPE